MSPLGNTSWCIERGFNVPPTVCTFGSETVRRVIGAIEWPSCPCQWCKHWLDSFLGGWSRHYAFPSSVDRFVSPITMATTSLNIYMYIYIIWILTNPPLDNFFFFLNYPCLQSFKKKNQKLIIMSSIKYLNFKFCSLKLCIKSKFMDQNVNNI